MLTGGFLRRGRMKGITSLRLLYSPNDLSITTGETYKRSRDASRDSYRG